MVLYLGPEGAPQFSGSSRVPRVGSRGCCCLDSFVSRVRDLSTISPSEVLNAVKGLPDATTLVSLLAAGGDPNAKVDGRPVLDYALTLGYVEKVRLLLAHGADPNVHEEPDLENNGRYAPPLNIVSRHDSRVDMLSMLLEAGANPNLCDYMGVSPLMTAAMSGAFEALSTLLQSGANAALETPIGQTALHFAMTRDSPKIVRRLLELKLDPNKVPLPRGLSPLQLAQKRRHVATVALLAEFGYV